MSYGQAHVPVVFGVAVARQATESFVAGILVELEHSFRHTDWIIVVAHSTAQIQILARDETGKLIEREHIDPRAGLAHDATTGLGDACATYLLRSCAVIFEKTGDDAPPPELHAALERHAGALPMHTPSAGNHVSVFSLPEPAPIFRVQNSATLKQLGVDAARAVDALRPRPMRVSAGLLRGEREVEAPREEPARSLYRTREVLRQWANIDEFNQEAGDWERKNASKDTLPKDSPLGRRATVLNTLGVFAEPRDDLSRMNRAFIAADKLSGKWQAKWSRMRLAEVKALANRTSPGWPRPLSLFLLAVLAAVLLAMASEFAETSPFPDSWFEGREHVPGSLFFVGYAGVLLVGLWRLITYRARRIEGRHQDYRLLAEGLRIQFFWSAAAPYGSGSGDAMRSYVADHIPLARRSAMFWVRAALHGIRFSAAPARGVAADAPERATAEWDSIGEALIEDQLNYGSTMLLQRRHDALHRLHGWSRFFLSSFLLFFFVLLVRALLQLTVAAFGHVFPEVAISVLEIPAVGHYLVIGMVVSLVISLSAGEVAEGFGLEAEIRRGEATNAVLESAKHHWRNTRVDAADSDPAALTRAIEEREQLLFELGRLMIDDYTEWFHIHHERPAQPIHG